MKVSVSFELPLPEGFEPYLLLIAKSHGYVEGGETSLEDFICREVCEKQVSSLFRTLVKSALGGQLGIVGQPQIAVIEQSFDALHSVSASITE